jgi:hypothetical protein
MMIEAVPYSAPAQSAAKMVDRAPAQFNCQYSVLCKLMQLRYKQLHSSAFISQSIVLSSYKCTKLKEI